MSDFLSSSLSSSSSFPDPVRTTTFSIRTAATTTTTNESGEASSELVESHPQHPLHVDRTPSSVSASSGSSCSEDEEEEDLRMPLHIFPAVAAAIEQRENSNSLSKNGNNSHKKRRRSTRSSRSNSLVPILAEISAAEEEEEEEDSSPAASLSPAPSSSSWLHFAWKCHICISFIVLAWGATHNYQGTKYVPLPLSQAGPHCRLAFLNVMADAETDSNAIVCCQDEPTVTPTSVVRMIVSRLFHPSEPIGICEAIETSRSFPLAGRLSRFPEAWLIPLFPMMIRILCFFYQIVSGRCCCVVRDYEIKKANAVLFFRRLALYIVVLNFRGYGLYHGLNYIESHLVSRAAPDTCWYTGKLDRNRPGCYGREFDFSDHVVLYLAGIQSLALVEVLHCLDQPFWISSRRIKATTVSSPLPQHQSLYSHWVPLSLIGCMAYLYFITFLGAYKTGAFFHTRMESYTGFVVSLFVTVPLFYLQTCNGGSSNKVVMFVHKARIYFFGDNSNNTN